MDFVQARLAHSEQVPAVVVVTPVQVAPTVQQSAAVKQTPAATLQHLSLVHVPMRQVAADVQLLPDASPHAMIVPSVVHGNPPAHWSEAVHS